MIISGGFSGNWGASIRAMARTVAMKIAVTTSRGITVHVTSIEREPKFGAGSAAPARARYRRRLQATRPHTIRKTTSARITRSVNSVAMTRVWGECELRKLNGIVHEWGNRGLV